MRKTQVIGRTPMVDRLESRSYFSAGVSPITPAITSTLPKSHIVAGVKLNPIHEKVSLINTGDTIITGPVTVNLLLSTDAVLSDDDLIVSTLNIEHFTLKPLGHKTEVLAMKSVPSGAAGAYFMIAQVTDPNLNQSSAGSASTVTVVPADVDLTGAFIKTPAAARIGHVSSTIFSITNDGTIAANGKLEYMIFGSENGLVDNSSTKLADITQYKSIKPGQTIQIHLTKDVPITTAGPYFLIAELDPLNVFNDANRTNNTFVSKTTVQVS